MSGATPAKSGDGAPRGLDLAEGRKRLLATAVGRFAPDPAVTGAFLSGSLASGAADIWSDIDLRVVVRPEHHASFVQRRLEIPRSWDGFLFNEWMDGTLHCVSHFQPFCKVDVFHLNQASFQPSPWLAQPIAILHDPQGLVAKVLANSQELRFAPDCGEIERVISKGLASAHEAYRRICRGELVYAQSLLDELRQYMAMLDDSLHDRPPQSAVLSRWEARASSNLLEAVAASYVGLEQANLKGALGRLTGWYRHQVVALHRAFAMDRPIERDLEAIDFVLRALR